MKTLIKSHPLVSFFVLTFGFTWLCWGLVYAFRLSMTAGYVPFLIGAAGPSLMAFVVSAVSGGRPAVSALWKRVMLWRVSWVWYVAALFLPSFIALGGIGLSVLFGGPAPDFSMLARQWFLIPIALVVGILLGGPLEEEFGWRGFATVRLQERHSALTTAIIVGILWGLWHLPCIPDSLVHSAWPAPGALPAP